ncbi:MAG: Methylmalonyl-CoA carboxyltransferase 12S subunit [Chlamydiae bacterium]|nr:Methylmalonyl-CoA carboxyltransferase 12S subunit [Chlamydiota bacterium]
MTLLDLTEQLGREEEELRQGGNPERQYRLGRLTVRERLKILCDDEFLELGLWAAHGMYEEWGKFPAAGVVTGIGKVSGRLCMIIANDGTVKAGAMFPQSVKKVLRAQNIAFACRLPTLYLVDSSGVFLPLQDEIFPDEDDFGRIFRNNALFSSAGIPQFAAIMGNCIAGGGYLPVLCDQLLMTEGSGLYIAGPALVKAAIGHDVDTEELGGAKMHAEISGTVDYREKDDPSCLQRLRSLVEKLPSDEENSIDSDPATDPYKLYDLIGAQNEKEYEAHDLIKCLVDKGSVQEYKADYGKTLVTVFAKIGGMPVGVIANQRKHQKTSQGEVEIGGVLYSDSADKGARFIMDCNQMHIPLVFLQDVVGFMVGVAAEKSGIIRCGAKLVNALSNSVVPKITVVVGNSFGAGNYALCGKAFDPTFIFAWPNAKYAVMGGDQAASTLFHIEKRGHDWNQEEAEERRSQIKQRYDEQMDIRYGAARGWIDGIIAPHETRKILRDTLICVNRNPNRDRRFHTGVIQV